MVGGGDPFHPKVWIKQVYISRTVEARNFEFGTEMDGNEY